ncbi:FmdB family transcriptional regulator [Rhodococcus sp. BP-252]|uniref:FmdB family zinc ribbon protein n=1 Tax=Nocardiaceae TaxID=85025 RepID=UPI000A02C7AB|nr:MULTISPECIES: FmdB family zinc ribbon protein [Rhodococcus]MBY6414584.1 FmdB family transcriptional regulator [Rhodococcus sp. BP-320]MBY6419341.1 FmdB family transcriptional regulator [Rhodococcus sp. BP-321]MBY6424323.1 FmdB family transcriptional regulator [Rhodococcus sp. BP-324]MBY6429420.1 FmdB family transcriptional regulator [Rhodococcus sp. BP-323]MBY6431939.1 FmdB family transcriptional regulator [Rhodococcus sp. BP-322]
MPTYSYACTECDNRFDIVQSFSDDSLTVCPQCSGKLRKLFNSVGIVFKGSGFYRTDSRGGSSTASESAGESKSDKSSTKTESTTSTSTSSTSSTSSSSSSSTTSTAAASS